MIRFQCECGWGIYTETSISMLCPQCAKLVVCDTGVTTNQVPVQVRTNMAPVFHQLWKEIHESAWVHWETIQEWYAEWLKRIPFIGCDCAINWESKTKEFPPDFSSRCKFFQWTVDRHNDINKLHKKKEWSVTEALFLYYIPPHPKKLTCDVIIPFCDKDSHWVSEAVESIQAQVDARPIIHVISDNAQWPVLPNGIHRYQTTESVGPYRITNLLLPRLKNDYVALLDGDDIALPERLAYQLNVLKDLDYDCISNAMEQFGVDEETDEIVQAEPFVRPGRVYPTVTPFGCCTNSTRTIKREWLLKLNGFCDWMCSADFELDSRLAFAGARLFHGQQILGRRRFHNTSLSHGLIPMRSPERIRYNSMIEEHVKAMEAGADPLQYGDLHRPGRGELIVL